MILFCQNMIDNVEIIRSNRKKVSLEIGVDMKIRVRAPIKMKNADIERFVTEKMSWIEKRLKVMYAYDKSEQKVFTDDEMRKLKEKALSVILPSVEKYAKIMSVSYGKISIKSQRTRWGSCSSKGNLNFNCLLACCPNEVVEYVIIHELCHLKYMDHSKNFWNTVGKYCPDYENHIKWLNENGIYLIRRLKKNA